MDERADNMGPFQLLQSVIEVFFDAETQRRRLGLSLGGITFLSQKQNSASLRLCVEKQQPHRTGKGQTLPDFGPRTSDSHSQYS